MSEQRDWVDERESAWRQDLRSVSLVAELEIDDDELERAERILGGLLRRNPVEAVAAHNPAFLVVGLTAVGMRSWQEGTFYANVAGALDVPAEKLQRATREFQSCLRRLRLPTFEQAEGMRWVTPVLLHGAVPLDNLDELLDLLNARRRRDPSLTGESFVEWARLAPGALAGQPKALVRFLEFGGDFAPDYVGRVMELVDGGDALLPRRVVERLGSLLVGTTSPTRARRESRPSLALLPDSRLVLRVPAVRPPKGREVLWRITFGGEVVEAVASVPYQAGRHTTDGLAVEVGTPVRQIAVEREGSSTVLLFVRSEDPLLVFDARGEFVPPTSVCPQGLVTVMWPSSANARPTDANGDLLEGTPRDVPFGWEGWESLDTTLPARGSIRLGLGPRHLVAGDDRAQLAEALSIEALKTTDGRPVLSRRPAVSIPEDSQLAAWTVVVTDGDGSVLEKTIPETHTVELLRGYTGLYVGELTVTVRGPLGKGLTQLLAIAESVEVRCTPSHRALTEVGGLESTVVEVLRAGQVLTSFSLSPQELQRQCAIDGWPFVVEPAHTSFAVVRKDEAIRWTTSPVRLTPDDLPEASLRVRGLPAGRSPMLVLHSATMTQEIRASGPSRSFVHFDLSALADHARAAGSGTVWLDNGRRVPVAALRAQHLADSVRTTGDRVLVETPVTAPLEIAVHRIAAPWAPGVVIPVRSDGAHLTPDIASGGPIRIQVRTTNEWAPEPTDQFPKAGLDVFDLDLPWDPALEDEALRPIAAALLGVPETLQGEPIRTSALARVFQVLGSRGLRTHIDAACRHRLTHLVADNPGQSLAAVIETAADSRAVTATLVSSGLAAAPVGDVARLDLVESLLSRSALAAVIAASGELSEPSARAGRLGAMLSQALGSELASLWAGGGQEHAELGRFESSFLEHPGLVRTWYELLAPVPALILDEDARIAAAYEMWAARPALQEPVAGAMPTVSLTRSLIFEAAPGLWPLVKARATQDGVLALPVLSIALALVARLSAHVGGGATELYASRRHQHGVLARWAPEIVAIDLIRADAAVIGALT